MLTPKTTSHIEFFPLEGGLFEARCPELGLSAMGSTPAEAEAAILRLIDERTLQIGEVYSPSGLASAIDTRVVESEDDEGPA